MDGTQCEEALMLYMERIKTILIHVLVYHFDIFLLIPTSSCGLAGLL